ncbi:MAG: type II secretion system F family protein [Sedimenticolaceae bacterium]|jgi:general secretion pathway protein F
MPLFRYKAATGDGQVIEGRIEAHDRQGAAHKLQGEGKIPIQIDNAGQTPIDAPRAAERRGSRQARSTDIDLFTLELATLLRAGLPLGQALDMLEGLADSPTMAHIAATVNTAVRGGKPLSSALEEADPGFDRFYCNMVRAGESSGALDIALERMADFRANRRELRQALISALLYPAILLLLALVAVAVLLAFVVPQFTQLFAEAGRELPLLTRIVAGAGELVTGWWWLMLAGLGSAIWWLHHDWTSPAGRVRWDTRLLQLPMIGPLIRKLQTARFARTLSTLLMNGVHLLSAMDIAKEIVGNAVMARALSQVARRVREGESLARPLAESGALPTLATQLIKLGETTGRLEQLLAQVADIYERDVQTTLKRLLTLAEPAIIITIALLVTVIILSVVLMILESNNLAF